MKILVFAVSFWALLCGLAQATLITGSSWTDSSLGDSGRTTVVSSNGSNLSPWYLTNSNGPANYAVIEDSVLGKSVELKRTYSAMTNFDSVTLEVGQSLQIDMTYRYLEEPTAGVRGLRMMLLNSNAATLPTADGTSPNNQGGYTGYSFLLGTTGTSESNTQTAIRRRDQGGALGTESGTNLRAVFTGVEDPTLAHDVRLIVTRNTEDIYLELFVDGISIASVTDTAVPGSQYWTFNSFVLSNNVSAGGVPSLLMTDFSITQIPESADVALLFGLLACAGLLRSRLRKS